MQNFESTKVLDGGSLEAEVESCFEKKHAVGMHLKAVPIPDFVSEVCLGDSLEKGPQWMSSTQWRIHEGVRD